MKKKILGILDVDEEYAMNLVSFMNKRNHRECEIAGFTSVENVAQYLKSKPIELLLVSDKVDQEEVKKLNIENVIVLSEEQPVDMQQMSEGQQEMEGQQMTAGTQPAEKNQPTVYKYQSAQLLVREVMTYYAKMEALRMMKNGSRHTVQRIGVFSLSDACQRMMVSIVMAQERGKRAPCLYLNFEEYTGIRKLLGLKQSGTIRKGDLSDFVYCYKNQKEHLEEKLEQMIVKIRNMDMLAPVVVSSDLYEISISEWREIIDKITYISHYETMVLDIGAGMCREIEQWMDICDKLYLVCGSGMEEMARVEEFQEYMGNTVARSILDRIHVILVPEKCNWGGCQEQSFMEYLCDSRWGRDVINRIQESATFNLGGQK